MAQNDKNTGNAGNQGQKASEQARNVGDQARQAAAGAAGQAQEAASSAMDRAKDMASSAAQTVREQTQAGTAAVGAGMRNLAAGLRENVPQEGMLGSAAGGLADTLQRGGDYLEHEGLGGMMNDVGAMIRRNPLPAVLVAVGVGFVLAQLLRSNER